MRGIQGGYQRVASHPKGLIGLYSSKMHFSTRLLAGKPEPDEEFKARDYSLVGSGKVKGEGAYRLNWW